jgi:hypothetical protein
MITAATAGDLDDVARLLEKFFVPQTLIARWPESPCSR